MKTITSAALLMLSTALSGCAATSVRGMRERVPVLVSDSARSLAAISACVSEKWVSLGFAPRAIPRENGGTLLVEQVITYALPIMLIDMDDTATGTHVTMRQFKSLSGKQNHQRIEEVQACL